MRSPFDGDLHGHQPASETDPGSDLSAADVVTAACEAWDGRPRDEDRAARLWQLAGELAGDQKLIDAAIALQQAERERCVEGAANTLVHDRWSFQMASGDEYEASNRAFDAAEQAMATAGDRAAAVARALIDPRRTRRWLRRAWIALRYSRS